MISDIFISSTISDKVLEPLLENTSFPLTKAEIIHKAEAQGVPSPLLALLRNLPSRFYRSKNELSSQCVCRSAGVLRQQGTIRYGPSYPRWDTRFEGYRCDEGDRAYRG